MDNSTRTLVNSGLNTLMMIAFAVPDGAPVGIGLAGTVFLFDVLFPPAPPQSPPVTIGELEQALASLKRELIDAIWQGKADHITDEVLALQKGFEELYATMGKLEVIGGQYVLSVTNDTIKHFVAGTYDYFDTQDPNGVLTQLRSFRNVLERRSLNDASLSALQVAEHKTRTIGLYALIGSLTAGYLKAACDWKWGRELLVAAQYKAYQATLMQWKADNGTDPTAADRREIAKLYPGVNTDPKYSPPDWNAWINYASCPVPRLIAEVQLMLDYCVGEPDDPGLYTVMLAHLDDLESLADSGDVMAPASPVSERDLMNAVAAGEERAALLELMTAKYALGGVTEDDIDGLGEAIAAWRTYAANVDYTTYTAVPDPRAGHQPDSLGLIAHDQGFRNQKEQDDYVQVLYDTNPGVTWATKGFWYDTYTPALGAVLKLYNPKTVAYLEP